MVYASFWRVKLVSTGTLKELFNVGDVLCEAVRWKGLEEDPAIALALDAWIEEHEYPAIVERAD